MSNKRNALAAVILTLVLLVSVAPHINAQDDAWSVSALPASVRIDPVDGAIGSGDSGPYDMRPMGELLESNWVYDGQSVELHGARGE